MTRVLCYGDSNTFGYNPADGMRFPEDIRWTGRLATLLGDGYRIIEEGCNGRTTVYDDPVEPWKNGLPYLRPCLHSHRPVDIVILLLGSNDLKDAFGLSPEDIAKGAGTLVKAIQGFTIEKQGFVPEIILVSPPEIGHGIRKSAFYGQFKEDAIHRSRQFPQHYRKIASIYGCVFFDSSEWVQPSGIDSLHLDEEGHSVLAGKLCEVIKGL